MESFRIVTMCFSSEKLNWFIRVEAKRTNFLKIESVKILILYLWKLEMNDFIVGLTLHKINADRTFQKNVIWYESYFIWAPHNMGHIMANIIWVIGKQIRYWNKMLKNSSMSSGSHQKIPFYFGFISFRSKIGGCQQIKKQLGFGSRWSEVISPALRWPATVAKRQKLGKSQSGKCFPNWRS